MKYISFSGIERYDNQEFKDAELVKWIKENVPTSFCNYATWGVSRSRPPYMCGIYLDPEQVTLFKLKFGL